MTTNTELRKWAKEMIHFAKGCVVESRHITSLDWAINDAPNFCDPNYEFRIPNFHRKLIDAWEKNKEDNTLKLLLQRNVDREDSYYVDLTNVLSPIEFYVNCRYQIVKVLFDSPAQEWQDD